MSVFKLQNLVKNIKSQLFSQNLDSKFSRKFYGRGSAFLLVRSPVAFSFTLIVAVRRGQVVLNFGCSCREETRVRYQARKGVNFDGISTQKLATLWDSAACGGYLIFLVCKLILNSVISLFPNSSIYIQLFLFFHMVRFFSWMRSISH